MSRRPVTTTVADCLAAAQRIATEIQRLPIHTAAQRLAAIEMLQRSAVQLHGLACDAGRALPREEGRALRARQAQRFCQLWEESIAKAEAEGDEEDAALFREQLAQSTAAVIVETCEGVIPQLPQKDELPS